MADLRILHRIAQPFDFSLCGFRRGFPIACRAFQRFREWDAVLGAELTVNGRSHGFRYRLQRGLRRIRVLIDLLHYAGYVDAAGASLRFESSRFGNSRFEAFAGDYRCGRGEGFADLRLDGGEIDDAGELRRILQASLSLSISAEKLPDVLRRSGQNLLPGRLRIFSCGHLRHLPRDYA